MAPAIVRGLPSRPSSPAEIDRPGTLELVTQLGLFENAMEALSKKRARVDSLRLRVAATDRLLSRKIAKQRRKEDTLNRLMLPKARDKSDAFGKLYRLPRDARHHSQEYKEWTHRYGTWVTTFKQWRTEKDYLDSLEAERRRLYEPLVRWERRLRREETELRDRMLAVELTLTRLDSYLDLIHPPCHETNDDDLTIKLPVRINGVMLTAKPDTGSAENVMSEETATRLRLTIERAKTQEFLLANGVTAWATGFVSANLRFANEDTVDVPTGFYVLESLPVPLLVGRAFLDETQTLTRYKGRLQVSSISEANHARVMHLSASNERMICYVDGELVYANPDTGSNRNLVSREYALKRGWTIEPITPKGAEIELANGTKTTLQGKVRARFHTMRAFNREKKGRIHTFYVLDGLTSDVLLGETLLWRIQAFEKHSDAFITLETDLTTLIDQNICAPLNLIIWCSCHEMRVLRAMDSTSVKSAHYGLSSILRIPKFHRRRNPAPDLRPDTLRHQPPDMKACYHELAIQDARELSRRESADMHIRTLSGNERVVKEEEESRRRREYDNRRQHRVGNTA